MVSKDKQIIYFEKYLETNVDAVKNISESIELISTNIQAIKLSIDDDKKSDRRFYKWIVGLLVGAVITLSAARVLNI